MIHLCVRDAVHRGPGVQMTRSAVHYTHDGVLESEDVLSIREMTLLGNDGDGGVALLCQLLRSIDPPRVAMTSQASGPEMTPHGDDGDHGGGGVALLLQLLEDIRRPAVAVTLLASGLK